jgi:hypothetical protein
VNVDTSGGKNNSALIKGKWKLLNGFSLRYDGWWSNDPYTHTSPNKTQEVCAFICVVCCGVLWWV